MSEQDRTRPTDRRTPPPPPTWPFALLLAVALLAGSVALALGGPAGPEEVDVPVDGQPHTVAVEAFRPTIGLTVADPEPQCTVLDPVTGGEIPLAPPSRSRSRESDVGEGYLTFLAFTPSIDEVSVTCTARAEGAGTSDEPVVITAESANRPYVVARFVGAGLLGVLGLVVLVRLVVTTRRRRTTG